MVLVIDELQRGALSRIKEFGALTAAMFGDVDVGSSVLSSVVPNLTLDLFLGGVPPPT